MSKKKVKNTNTVKAQRSSSKSGFHFINLFQNCPRKFFIKYLLRLDTKSTSPALIGGSAFHEGKEVFYKTKSMKKAVSKCEREIKLREDEYPNEDLFEKDFIRYPILLEKWCEELGYNDLETKDMLFVEKELVVPITGTDGFVLTMRIDAAWKDKEDSRYYLVDTKTSSFSITIANDTLHYGDQPTAYLFGASKAMPDIKFEGLLPDIAYWNKNAIRMDNISCVRGDLVRRNKGQLEQFEKGIALLFNELSQKVTAYSSGKFDEYDLFPRNTYYCMSYNRRCEYSEICRTNISSSGRAPAGFYRVPKKKSVDFGYFTDDSCTLV